jgi:hypothetical protein
MTEQSTALRLADDLEDAALPTFIVKPAAAELRRLHALNAELLEALKSTRAFVNSVAPHGGLFERTRATIARAEGKV